MIRRLQIKFVIINMATVTVMLCAIFVLVYQFTRRDLEAESIAMMKTIAADPVQLGRPEEPSPELRLPYFTVLLGIQGELLATGGGYYDLSDEDFLHEVIDCSLSSSRDIGVIEEHGLRFCRVKTPRSTVLVFADMSSENSTLSHLLETSLAIGALSFLVFLLISIALARWAVRPVETAWRQQKQFVADASHELKTPLTVILTNAELLQCDGYDEIERSGFSRGILLMSRQMQSLVEKLLALARSDTEEHRQRMAPLDFSALVLDTALSFEGVFAERGLTLESEIEPNIRVRGSEAALTQLIDILLDNAQKYSCGGVTHISLRTAAQGRCRLVVSDPGAEIPPQELKNIFRRFYRIDKARSRDGSFGLGLSIAENIVCQHHGTIWAESGNGINSFFVELRRCG